MRTSGPRAYLFTLEMLGSHLSLLCRSSHQVFSLMYGSVQSEIKGGGKAPAPSQNSVLNIGEEGVLFRSYRYVRQSCFALCPTGLFTFNNSHTASFHPLLWRFGPSRSWLSGCEECCQSF